MNIDDIKPTGFSPTSTAESQSIKTLEYIIDDEFVKVDLKSGDKIPNIDGYLILADKEQVKIGTLEVQVKTLRKSKSKKVSYPCPVGFLSYCHRNDLPVLLIVVDSDNKKAYWVHINHSITRNLTPKGKTVSISLPIQNCISETDKGYIQEWIDICKSRNYYAENFRLERECLLEEQIEQLKKMVTVTVGEEDPIFKELHSFLDQYNGLLDREFSNIKASMYEDIWKLGIAIGQYKDSQVDYIIYPVKATVNDVQIKRITKENEDTIEDQALKRCYMSGNPFKKDALKYAYELIQDDVNEVLKQKGLLLITDFIANEYLVKFIERNALLLNLDEDADDFTIALLRDGLEVFLPIWIDEAVIERKLEPSLVYTINIDEFNWHMSDKTREKIHKRALDRYKVKEYSKSKYRIISKTFNLSLINRLIRYKDSISEKLIKRVYAKWEETNNETTTLIFDLYTKESFLTNVKRFYTNLPEAYEGFVNTFFPLLKDEFDYFLKSDRLLVLIDEQWSLNVIFLKEVGNSSSIKQVDVYYETDISKPLSWDDIWVHPYNHIYQIGNSKYQRIYAYSERADFLFNEEFPMQYYLYKTLEYDFSKYFERKRGDNQFDDIINLN